MKKSVSLLKLFFKVLIVTLLESGYMFLEHSYRFLPWLTPLDLLAVGYGGPASEVDALINKHRGVFWYWFGFADGVAGYFAALQSVAVLVHSKNALDKLVPRDRDVLGHLQVLDVVVGVVDSSRRLTADARRGHQLLDLCANTFDGRAVRYLPVLPDDDLDAVAVPGLGVPRVRRLLR